MPALLPFAGVVRFMLKHFFVNAPYLLDTGMLSGLAYRDGLWLPMPRIACDYANVYYDVYFSPLTSLFSLTSYLVPVGRIAWFVFVQGLVYVPIGLAVGLAASRLEPASAWRRLPITVAAALAFTFSGQVLWMVGYPHLEAAMPGLVCLVLAALLTGRFRLAWVCLALAASVRQDCGIHLALAMSPLVLLRWRGVAMPPSLRRLIVMSAVAVGLSVAGMLSIRLFFTPFPRLAQAYLGSPLYSHLSVELLRARVHGFIDGNQVIYYPFLATCLLAVLRRDAGYLLGWAACLPWFTFCFLAREEVKAAFAVYSIGPFIVAMFWVYLYGAYLARRRPSAAVTEALFVLVCIASTLGAYRAQPRPIAFAAREMLRSKRMDRDAVYTFIRAIRDHRDRFRVLRVDGPVAALAMEHLANDPRKEHWTPGLYADTIAFHQQSYEKFSIAAGLTANGLEACTHVLHTGLVMCTREPLPADTFAGAAIEPVPATFAFAEIKTTERRFVHFDERGVVIDHPFDLRGTFGTLPRGTYRWTMTLSDAGPAGTEERARVEVTQGGRSSSTMMIEAGATSVTLRFDSDGGDIPLRYHLTTRGATPLIITSSRLAPEAGRDP
jgi:hypothetical protein